MFWHNWAAGLYLSFQAIFNTEKYLFLLWVKHMCYFDELCPIALARGQQEGEETLSLRCRVLSGRGDETVHCADALQFYFVLRQTCSLLCYYVHLEVFQDINCPNLMVLKYFLSSCPDHTLRLFSYGGKHVCCFDDMFPNALARGQFDK